MTARCLLALLLLPACASAKGDPFRFPAGKAGPAELKHVNGVPVLVVSGTPAEVGTGVGALALKPARRVLGYPRDLLDHHGIGKLWPAMLLAGKGMLRRFPEDYAAELDAVRRASGADADDLVAGNTLFDVKRSLACSALMVTPQASATGGPLLARNLDYPSLGYVHEYTLVTVYRPKGKLAFVSVGFPGLVGVLSGMNEAGLCVAVLEVTEVKDGETPFDARGVPYALCLREMLEKAKTIDEAVKVLEARRRTCCINVAMADANGVAVLEVTPGRVVRLAARRGVCAATNHFRSPDLAPGDADPKDGSVRRLRSLEAVRSRHDRPAVKDLLSEMGRVDQGELTLQTMAFEPAAFRLHLAVGSIPATKGPARAVELRALLRPGE